MGNLNSYAGGKIQNRESALAQGKTGRLIKPHAGIIGATVDKGFRHPANDRLRFVSAAAPRLPETGQAAHTSSPCIHILIAT